MIHTQWCLSQLHKVASQLFAGISSDQRRLLLLKGTLLHLAVTQKGKNRGTPFHILKPKLYISSKDTQRQIWSYDSIQYIHVGKIYIYMAIRRSGWPAANMISLSKSYSSNSGSSAPCTEQPKQSSHTRTAIEFSGWPAPDTASVRLEQLYTHVLFLAGCFGWIPLLLQILQA